MKYWTHGIELNNLDELKILYTIHKKEGWDNYLIETEE